MVFYREKVKNVRDEKFEKKENKTKQNFRMPNFFA